ncbi:MAG TPA: WYL domain-containing protein [Trebonia sp.]|jgi:predicted DNA-binding transcriptional regulator YafY|nr:WYL domain-containing protein [Trebonia sp.]
MTAERLLRLLSLFTVRRCWGGDELAQRLGVTPRTIRRDVERLRDLGYQVRAVPGPYGGYELGAGTGLPPLLLDDDAAVAVAVGLRAVAGGAVGGMEGAGMEEAAVRAAAVIERVLPGRLRARIDALRAAVVPLRGVRPDAAAVRPETLALLALACRDGERIRFGYTDAEGTASSRHAEPYRLVVTARHWYLVARDLDKGEWRSFRLDRLERPLRTGHRARPAGTPEAPGAPDAARFVAEGIAAGAYRYQARVLVAAPADVVAARIPGLGAVIEAVSESACLVISGSNYLDMIALHFASLDLPFTPLEPPELRARCAALSRRLGEAAGSTGSAAAELLPAEDPHGQPSAGQRPGAEHE